MASPLEKGGQGDLPLLFSQEAWTGSFCCCANQSARIERALRHRSGAQRTGKAIGRSGAASPPRIFSGPPMKANS